jgi:hypothetical protein
MARRLVSIALACSFLAVVGPGAAADERQAAARIAITRITIEDGTATVRVAVSGFPASRGHWDLVYTLLDKKPGHRGVAHVRRGTVASPFTNLLAGERWRFTARLVDNRHRRVFASDSKVRRVT